MKAIKISLIAACAAFAASCSSDFLESSPIMSNVESQFYTSDAEMFKALVACYDPLQYSAKAMIGVTIPFSEIHSDNANCGGASENDQPDMQRIENFSNTNVCSIAEANWTYKYKGMYRCNKLIDAAYTSDAAEVYRAEAKVLRAWYLFDAMRFFGPCFIANKSYYPNGYEFTRSTREEVNAQIEKDLLEAIPVLEESFGDDMTGRIRKSAAQAFLAKQYLYNADWDNDNVETFKKAIPLLKEVIASGEYTLVNDYSKLFGFANNNNSESIFEIQRSTFSGNTAWGDAIDNKSEGCYWAAPCGVRGVANHPNLFAGWGFMLPTQDLYDYFLDDDTARRDAAFLTFNEVDGIPNGDKTSTWDTTQYNSDFEGYAQQKYTAEIVPYSGAQLLNLPGNDRLIRFGEVYLMLAEAYLRGENNEAEAIKCIETLRDAHVPGGRSVAQMMADFPSRFPTVLDVLWYERRCELAGEGDRWFDLVRTGRAPEVMKNFLENTRKENKHTNFTWDKKFNYLPIGSIELGNCPSLTEYPAEAFE